MKLFQVWRQKEEWEEEKFKSQLPTLLPQHRGENLNLNFKSNVVQYRGYTSFEESESPGFSWIPSCANIRSIQGTASTSQSSFRDLNNLVIFDC